MGITRNGSPKPLISLEAPFIAYMGGNAHLTTDQLERST